VYKNIFKLKIFMKMFSFHKHLFLLFFLEFCIKFVEINAENTVSVTISNGVIQW